MRNPPATIEAAIANLETTLAFTVFALNRMAREEHAEGKR